MTARTVTGAMDLRVLFEPASVAVVGVGRDPLSPGNRVFRNLRRGVAGRPFAGPVYGVNRNAANVDGQPTAASLAELPDVPELVVLATPAEHAEALVDQCASLGVGAVVVLAAGFAEAGEEGTAAQARMVAAARAAGTAIVGPNTMGLLSLPSRLAATFTNAVDEPNPGGRMAVVGQSGGMAAILYTAVLSHGIGVDHLVALGNEAIVTFGDVANWLVRNDRVDTVVGFVESLTGWDALADAADAAAANGTTIAVCRAGRSAVGADAIASHVGAIAGDDAVLSSVCRAKGIVEVPSLDGLVDVAKARAAARPLAGRRVGVLTASGGAGSLLADLLTEAGFEVPRLSPAVQARVQEVIPWYGSAANPVDTTAYVQNRPEVFGDVVRVMAASRELDAVEVFLGTLDPIADRLVEQVSAAAHAHPDVAVQVVWGGGARRFKRAMTAAGVATYDDPRRAVVGLAALRGPATSPAAAPARPPTAVRRGTVWNEHEVRHLLRARGLPIVPGELARTADDAVAAAADLGGAVVLKLVAAGAPHKSDVDGVLVDVRGEAAVRDGVARLLAAAASRGLTPGGVLVEQLAPPGVELLVAARRDATVGPVVVVGLGGRLAEIVAAVEVRPAPLSKVEAADAVRALLGGRLARHRRGLAPHSVDELAVLLVQLGDLTVELPWLLELECNPVVAHGDGLSICDGLAVVDDSARAEPA